MSASQPCCWPRYHSELGCYMQVGGGDLLSKHRVLITKGQEKQELVVSPLSHPRTDLISVTYHITHLDPTRPSWQEKRSS